MNAIKQLTLKAPDGREKQVLAFLPMEEYEQNFYAACKRKGLEVMVIEH